MDKIRESMKTKEYENTAAVAIVHLVMQGLGKPKVMCNVFGCPKGC